MKSSLICMSVRFFIEREWKKAIIHRRRLSSRSLGQETKLSPAESINPDWQLVYSSNESNNASAY